MSDLGSHCLPITGLILVNIIKEAAVAVLSINLIPRTSCI